MRATKMVENLADSTADLMVTSGVGMKELRLDAMTVVEMAASTAESKGNLKVAPTVGVKAVQRVV